MRDLDAKLAEYDSNTEPAATASLTPGVELPPILVDGIPTSVDQMTQAMLRNFIPVILKRRFRTWRIQKSSLTHQQDTVCSKWLIFQTSQTRRAN